MPLLTDQLSMWEIAHRWHGYDPHRPWWRAFRLLPLPVKETIRSMMDALLTGNLESVNITLEKDPGTNELPKEFYIRHHLDAIYACIAGQAYPKALIQLVAFDAWSFKRWCLQQNLSAPEFWTSLKQLPDVVEAESEGGDGVHTLEQTSGERTTDRDQPQPRTSRIDKESVQAVALTLWEIDHSLTISALAQHPSVLRFANGGLYEERTLHQWISKVDPRPKEQKTGRPRKRSEDESEK